MFCFSVPFLGLFHAFVFWWLWCLRWTCAKLSCFFNNVLIWFVNQSLTSAHWVIWGVWFSFLGFIWPCHPDFYKSTSSFFLLYTECWILLNTGFKSLGSVRFYIEIERICFYFCLLFNSFFMYVNIIAHYEDWSC